MSSFDPWVRKIPWRRAWQPTAVFLSGESYAQRILTGYSPWGHKESDTTEANEHAHTQSLIHHRTQITFVLVTNEHKILGVKPCRVHKFPLIQ